MAHFDPQAHGRNSGDVAIARYVIKCGPDVVAEYDECRWLTIGELQWDGELRLYAAESGVLLCHAGQPDAMHELVGVTHVEKIMDVVVEKIQFSADTLRCATEISPYSQLDVGGALLSHMRVANLDALRGNVRYQVVDVCRRLTSPAVYVRVSFLDAWRALRVGRRQHEIEVLPRAPQSRSAAAQVVFRMLATSSSKTEMMMFCAQPCFMNEVSQFQTLHGKQRN